MRLLRFTDKFEFGDFEDDELPPYAILSHTWNKNNDEEVKFQDINNGTSKSLLKLELCRDWARAAKLEWFWVDTCCINQNNDAELAYAIRSMWRWYQQAAICFVYLSDLSHKRKADGTVASSLRSCKWFERGWTLQEMIACDKLEFYGRDGYFGSKSTLMPQLKDITGIDLSASMPKHAKRLEWVSKRQTKRPEDKAYCMLGICDVSLPAEYGEGGDKAWQRLLAAITHRHGTVALEDSITNPRDHRQSILGALKFDALETRRNTVKVAMGKTCAWIKKHPACARWLNMEHKLFWIKGKPGTGKSVLMKYLDNLVTRTLKRGNAIGLYFYFNARGGHLEKSFLGLYRSLTIQLLAAVPDLAHHLDALSLQFDVADLQRILALAIRGSDREIWLFVDALDECHEDDVQDLITFFTELQDTKLHICFASRHYPIVEVPTELQLVLEGIVEHNNDLSQYIDQLRLKGEQLEQVRTEILEKAKGIFLWVILVVDILNRELRNGRGFTVQQRLREMPQGLPELFRAIIARDGENREDLLLCLRWVLYAWRPLELREWYFAMMSGLGHSLEDDGSVSDGEMQLYLTSSSKGLAELTTGKKTTAQFIHESVRDFLLQDGGFEDISDGAGAMESYAHDQLKQCCLKGIEFSLPNVQDAQSKKRIRQEDLRSELVIKTPFAAYAAAYILHHANGAAIDIDQQEFLSQDFDLRAWSERYNILRTSAMRAYPTRATISSTVAMNYICAEHGLSKLLRAPYQALEFAFPRCGSPLVAAYMAQQWEVVEIFLVSEQATNIQDLIFEAKSAGACRNLPRAVRQLPWRWAVMNGLAHLSRFLLKGARVEDMISHDAAENALSLAIESGEETVIEIVLQTQDSFIFHADNHAMSEALIAEAKEGKITGLGLAAAGGHTELVKMLLAADADVNAQGSSFNVLYAASEGGHREVVKLLLAAGADANANTGLNRNTALHVASAEGHGEVVKLLLAAGAFVNAKAGANHDTALHVASARGHGEVVKLLLASGADVNAQGGKYGSALQDACTRGDTEQVKLLLTAGADVNAQGGYYGHALQVACSHGEDTEVVKLLLAAGADVNAQGGACGNALQATCSRFQIDIKLVKLLLASGADANAQGGIYGNALQAASLGAHLELVRLLLASGADANAQGGEYGNALQAACSRTQVDIELVKLLIAGGADINAQGGFYGSALQAASARGHSQVVNLLLAMGARERHPV